MGAEVSSSRAALESATFKAPSPPSYTADRTPDGFFWISSGERRIPAVWHAWTSSTGEAAHFTLLFSHDYCDDLGTLHGDVILLKDTLHANVLAYDYAGYGLSGESVRSEAACLTDVQAAFDWLTTVKGVPATRVLLVGHGLGSGPSLYLASQLIPSSPPATLDAPINSGFFSKLLSTGRSASPAAPTRCLAGLVLLSAMTSVLAVRPGAAGAGGPNDIFDNLKRIDRCPGPVLLAHPINDELVAVAHAHKLVKRTGARLWRVVELRDVAKHVDASRSDEYLSAILEFVRYLAPDVQPVSGMPMPPVQYSQSPSFVVQDWLRQQDVPIVYAEIFLAEGYYDLNSLAAMRDADPVMQRIENATHRQRVLDGIVRLRQAQAQAQATDAPSTPQANSARALSPSRRAPNTAPQERRTNRIEKNGSSKPRSGRKGKDKDEPDEAQPFPGIPLHAQPPPLDITLQKSQSDRIPNPTLPSPRTPFTLNSAPLAPKTPERQVAGSAPAASSVLAMHANANNALLGANGAPPVSPRGPKVLAPTAVAYGVSSKKMERTPRVIKSDAEGVAGKDRPIPRSASPVADSARLDRYRATLVEILSAPAGDEWARILLERCGQVLEEPERDEGAKRRFEENLSKFKVADVPTVASSSGSGVAVHTISANNTNVTNSNKLPTGTHTSAALAVATTAPFRPAPPAGPPPRRVAAEAALAMAKVIVEQLRLDQAVASALTMNLSLRALQEQRTSLAGAQHAPPSMNGVGLPPMVPGTGARSMEMALATDMAAQLELHLKQNREVLARYIADLEAAAKAAALPLHQTDK